METIEDYELTEQQINACKEIKKAFKKAKKLGVTFFAKSGSICAYRDDALKHSVPAHQSHRWGAMIPEHQLTGCIMDSGADDDIYFDKDFIDEY